MATTTTNLGLPRPVAADNVTLASQQALIDAIDVHAVARSTADITYYVRTDGSDTNNGLANTAGGAFKTIGKALSLIPQVINHTVVINVAVGTYSETVTISGFVGSGTLAIKSGTASTPYVVNNFVVISNSIRVTVTDCQVSTVNPNRINKSFYLQDNVSVILDRIVNTFTNSGDDGIYVQTSRAFISNGIFSNKGSGIQATFLSLVYSADNGGTGNGNGLNSTNASSIGKGNAVQPAGTAAEFTAGGGVINS